MEITKEKFEEYRNCQNLGYFNMLDYYSWSEYTFLTKEEWFEIIKNYKEYLETFCE